MSDTAFKPTLTVKPSHAKVARGADQPFDAETNYPEGRRYFRQPVSWSVLEPEGGTITPNGVYTAPPQPGVFHVQAQRDDFPDLAVTATVTVE